MKSDGYALYDTFMRLRSKAITCSRPGIFGHLICISALPAFFFLCVRTYRKAGRHETDLVSRIGDHITPIRNHFWGCDLGFEVNGERGSDYGWEKSF